MPVMRLVTLLRLALLAAFLLAPMGMTGRHAAMAASMSPAAHCADMPASHHGSGTPEKAPSTNIDCVIACACVPPVAGGMVAAAPLFEAEVPSATWNAIFVSRNPAADPPPPRV